MIVVKDGARRNTVKIQVSRTPHTPMTAQAAGIAPQGNPHKKIDQQPDDRRVAREVLTDSYLSPARRKVTLTLSWPKASAQPVRSSIFPSRV